MPQDFFHSLKKNISFADHLQLGFFSFFLLTNCRFSGFSKTNANVFSVGFRAKRGGGGGQLIYVGKRKGSSGAETGLHIFLAQLLYYSA